MTGQRTGRPAITTARRRLAGPLGGPVAACHSMLSTAQPHVEGGRLVPLASTGPERLPALPGVPTIAESGHPGFRATNWYASVASSKVPPETLERCNVALVRVPKSPDVVDALNGHGLTPAPSWKKR